MEKDVLCEWANETTKALIWRRQ